MDDDEFAISNDFLKAKAYDEISNYIKECYDKKEYLNSGYLLGIINYVDKIIDK